ncbi:hypothetical protein, variant [Aphanomyces invadans]|uniref:TPPC8 first Ig-like domain-containing protein n=1 Tax=Aphanomyces invadans TaxID=157072 RepID=A0A024UK21_9STRA|nr:hypothetical protein, variant [Aphanomyces invadans]ETW06659.1 hypothetical protein, variant [Aphanomyces invadans]|eukprot:XP_008864734.1 hypothetical protein, variant [Aphanomyces invadans]
MELSEWIHTTHVPIILLNASDEAQRICRKNGGLSVEQLLNGFGVFTHADTPVRTINGHIRLPEMRLRFISTSRFKPSSSEETAVRLNHVVSTSATALTAGNNLPLVLDPVQTEADVPYFLRSIGGTAADSMPWYGSFKHEVMESFQCDDTSMMYHPHALMLVVSSTEADPRHAFHQLGLSERLPQVFQDGLYDMNLPKYYLVLHDTCETQHTSIDPAAIYRNLNIPPTSGGVVRINSLSTPVLNDVWSNHPYVRSLSPSSPDLPYGCFLSDEDRLALRTMVWEFGVKFVLPAIESKMFALNETVAAVRKGVRNALKAWWRKPKETANRASVYLYRFDSIESNMRLLADIAFLIRDYDLAYNMYRLVRDDYKNDKAMLHCAHANESIALCLYMMKGSAADIHHALETTAGIYSRLQVANSQLSLVRHSARTTIISSEIFMHIFRQNTNSEHMDSASAALIRGSSATDPKYSGLGICSAVFLERAAFCDLLARNTKFRKYGFRMVMAGHVYSMMGYEPHAARCYSCARAIYANTRWYQVDDHITGTLARQLCGLTLPQQAIALLLTRIGSGRHSKGQQLTLLAEFYDMVSEYLKDHSALGIPDFQVIEAGESKVLLIKALVIPAIQDQSVLVFAPDNAFELAAPVEKDDWKQVEFTLMKEERIEHLATSGEKDWLELALSPPGLLQLPLRGGKKKGEGKPKSYMLGETVYVEFHVKNPLACDVVLKQLHLFGTFQDADEFPSSQNSFVTAEFQDITLAPHAEEVVRLTFVAHHVGLVRISGVRWALNANVHGEHVFHLPGILLQDSLTNRATRARAPNSTLTCDIKPPMPWLGVSLTKDNKKLPWPLVCLEGEIMTLDLELVNKGTHALSNLTMVCSSWQYVVEGPNNNVVGATGHVKTLPTLTLQPGESKSFKVHCSSRTIGTETVRFLFRYSNMDNSYHRFVPLAFGIEVMKCLQVTHTIHPSYDNIKEYVLALSVHNGRKDGTKEPTPSMSILSLTSWSSYWKIQPFQPTLDAAVHRPPSVLQWQESSTFYFRVTQRDDGEVSSTIPLHVDASPPTHPFGDFLCLDNSSSRIAAAKNARNAAAGSKASHSSLMRSIQSVRRENKDQTKQHHANTQGGVVQRVKPTSANALVSSEVWLFRCHSRDFILLSR